MSSPESRSTKPATSRFVTMVSAISALAGLLFGYDTGVISGAILFVRKDFLLSTVQEEVVVAAVLLGAVAGASFGGKLADRFGRRKLLIQVAILFIVGAIGTALAPTPTWLAIGRVVVGVAIGIASFTAPLYISEVSPPAILLRESFRQDGKFENRTLANRSTGPRPALPPRGAPCAAASTSTPWPVRPPWARPSACFPRSNMWLAISTSPPRWVTASWAGWVCVP